MADNGLPTFNRTNIVAAVVIGAFSAGVLACNLYAPQFPKETAIIALFLIVTAGVLHIPLSSVVPPVQANVEHVQNMTLNTEATPANQSPPEPPPDDRPAVGTKGPRALK